MSTAQNFKGTGVALVTPFTEEGNVDVNALKALVDYLIEGGVNYLVSLGTTAETATLSLEEQELVAKCVYEQTAQRVPLVIGAGGNNTSAVITNIKENAWIQKYDALLIATPSYNKPNQEGLFQHFKAIAAATSKPIVLYNVPGRTGVNMTADTTLKLANSFDNIIGIKEASADLLQINKILNKKPTHFEVISGDDALTLPMIAIGAVGVVSVLANALPKEMSSLVNAALSGNYERAKTYQKELFELSQAIFLEGNPAGVKALMNKKNLLKNQLRLPLVAASSSLQNTLSSLLSVLERTKI